jgi:O-antigen ligase
MVLLLFVLVGFGSLALNLLRQRERELAFAPVNRFILLYAAVYLAGTVFSVNLRGSLPSGVLSVAFILFAVVLYNAVTGQRQLDSLIILMVLAATLVSFYGILQYLFGWGYQSAAWVDSDMFSSISFRVSSTLDNPNMLGQYLILAIPLGGAKLLTAKGVGERIFYFCCCGVMCVCMLLTFSRGAWLGLLFAGAVFLVLLNPRLILLAPVALVALYFVLPESVVSRFTSIGNLSDNSTSYRVNIWMGVLAMLRDGYWLCGIGPGDAAFNQVYPAYSYNAIVAPHSHNLFLQIICDAGVCALAVFLLVLFQYFRVLCIAMKGEKNGDSRMLQIAFTAGMCGFLVQAMTDYSFYNYRVMFLFWACVALGCLSARRSQLPQGGLIQ